MSIISRSPGYTLYLLLISYFTSDGCLGGIFFVCSGFEGERAGEIIIRKSLDVICEKCGVLGAAKTQVLEPFEVLSLKMGREE